MGHIAAREKLGLESIVSVIKLSIERQSLAALTLAR